MSKRKKKPIYSTVKRFREKDSGQWWGNEPFEEGEIFLFNGVPNKITVIGKSKKTVTPIKEGKIGKFLEAKLKPTEIEIEFNEEVTITGIKIKIK